MITASEHKVLQLAKKVFEHFTHDALPFARKIITMERELAKDQDNSVTIPVTLPPTPMSKNNEPVVSRPSDDVQTKPVAEVISIRIAGSLNHPRMRPVENVAAEQFEEVPY